MTDLLRPFRFLRLATVSDRVGNRAALTSNELAAIAEWLGALALELRRNDPLAARAMTPRPRPSLPPTVQACVVTPIRPLTSRRGQAPIPRYGCFALRRDQDSTVELSHAANDEDTEILSSSEIDLAAPLLEELALALDPYPRAPGVAFEPPREESEPSESPFAVLAKLKERSVTAPVPERNTKSKPKS
jgi:hypothetical protein